MNNETDTKLTRSYLSRFNSMEIEKQWADGRAEYLKEVITTGTEHGSGHGPLQKRTVKEVLDGDKKTTTVTEQYLITEASDTPLYDDSRSAYPGLENTRALDAEFRHRKTGVLLEMFSEVLPGSNDASIKKLMIEIKKLREE